MRFKNIPSLYSCDDAQVYSCSGSRVVPVYKPHIDHGRIELVADGTVDIYDKIQKNRESCDVHCLIERYLRGDQSALSRPNMPVYLDATDYPKTLAEYQQISINAEMEFYKLPVETRALFNHNLSEYIASFGTAKFAKAYGLDVPCAAPVGDPVVPSAQKGDEIIDD